MPLMYAAHMYIARPHTRPNALAATWLAHSISGSAPSPHDGLKHSRPALFKTHDAALTND